MHEIAVAATADDTTRPIAKTAREAPEAAMAVDGADVHDLIEDVSIDGMCGVY